MESKLTAVEWLVEQIKKHHINQDIKNTVVYDQAKQMEKEQIIDAWNKNPQGFNHLGEQYYNETYGHNHTS